MMANYFTHLAFEIPATAEDATRFSQEIEEAALVAGYGSGDNDAMEGIAYRFDKESETLAIFDTDGASTLALGQVRGAGSQHGDDFAGERCGDQTCGKMGGHGETLASAKAPATSESIPLLIVSSDLHKSAPRMILEQLGRTDIRSKPTRCCSMR